LRPDARLYWRFESFFLIYRCRQPQEKEREREKERNRTGTREEKWKKEEENGKRRVGPRAVGLMSLIMEKYIK